MKPGITSIAVLIALTFSSRLPAESAGDATKAGAFVAQAEKELAQLSVPANRSQWINNTYITDDTDAIAADFGRRWTELSVRLAKDAAKFDATQGLSFDVRRKLKLLISH